MKLKDIFEAFFLALGLFTFLVVLHAVVAAPFWISVIIAAVLWLIYVILVIRDNSRMNRPYFWIRDGRQRWRAIDLKGDLIPLEKTPSNPPITKGSSQAIFDQEDHK